MPESGVMIPEFSEDFELDQRAGELRKHGVTIRLPEQLFRLLTFLTERPGQVVTREDIRSSLWPDRFVNFDDSINSAIKRLRQCLADAGMNPNMVRTLPGRGYRFTLPTEQDAPVHKEDAEASVTTEPRLAVLPFRNLSGNPVEENLVAGLTDALVTALAKVPKMRLVSRRVARGGKSGDEMLSETGKKLKVDAVLNGTVLRSGNRVRVTVQLLNVVTEEYLWAESYDYLFRDILTFQGEVSGAIAEQVSEKLVPRSRQSSASPAHPRQPAAYQAYLKGHHVFQNVTDAGLLKARHYWKKAIHEDPEYAKAYAGLAQSYNMLGVTGLIPALDALVHSREAATKALELDETLSEAHTALAFTRMLEWDWEGAGRDFRRALQLDPNFTTGNPCHYVEYLLAMGHPEIAVAELERAQENQPTSLFLSVILGWAYYGTRQYDKAIWQHRRVVSIDPDFSMAQWCLGLDYAQKRRYRSAVDAFQKCRLLDGPHLAVSGLGYVFAVMGEKEKAQHLMKELKRGLKRSYTSPYIFASIHAGLGEIDAAFECLEQSCKAHDVGLIWLKWDPQFDNLRSDPRFQEILRTIGLHAQAYSASAAD